MSAAKFIGLIFLSVFIIGIVAVFYSMAANAHTTPYVDSYGSVQSNQTNQSQDATTAIVTAAPNAGLGAVFVLGAIALIAILVFAAAIFTSNRNSGRY